MDKDNAKKELQKIFSQKPLNNLIIICAVLAFILIALSVFKPSFMNKSDNNQIISKSNAEETAAMTESEKKDYEEQQKIDLKNILKKMEGVGDVDVMISFENGEEKVPAYDKSSQTSTTEESDNVGGKRQNNQVTDSDKVVMTSQNGNNEPFIIKTNKPKITGVVIVAEGAENSKTKYEIEQAVSKLYNLSLDKVNVYTMKK